MKIAICSLQAPIYTGGLAAYQRLLAKSLRSQNKATVSFVCSQANQDREFEAEALDSVDSFYTLETKWHSFWQVSLFPRLATRHLCHSMLERLCHFRWRPDVKTMSGLQDFDTIHFVGTGWDFFGFPLARLAQKSGAKFTVWPAVHPGTWGDDGIDLRLYNRADSVFCQSDFEARHLIERGLDARKVVRSGLPSMCRKDGDGEALRCELQISDRPAVFFLGRRDTGKGYPALLSAWLEVIQQLPDAVLLLAGPGGTEFENSKGRIPANSYRDLGVPNEKRKADAYAACDVFCLPSAHESFGIVYVEAWSYGKPVICGTAPASRELVQDGRTGLWADQDPANLADMLASLLLDPERSRNIGETGLQHQQGTYSEANMLAQHLRAWGNCEESSPCLA